MIHKSIGPYELVAEVGVGGMGAVYQAVHSKTDQIIAVKLLSQEYLEDLGLRTAFEREAKLVISLDHEAIVPVYDFGQDAGQPYLVTQYMPNGSLADRLQQSALTPKEMLPILERLCQAVDYAHEQGLIHRDIKPSNILFDKNDRAYLADFGIARHTTAYQAASPIDGTPAYLSPEQALGQENIDGRSDIYALGIVVYEALTGKLPFDSPLPIGVILQQIHTQAPSLRAANWNLPAALDEVVDQALAKDPSERYATAREFADAYRSALSSSKPSPQASSQPAVPAEEVDDGSVEKRRPEYQNQPILATDLPAQLEGDERPMSDPKDTRIDFSASSSPSTQKSWRSAHIVALGFVTMMGFIMAAGLVAFLHMPQQNMLPADGSQGFSIEYDRESFVLINQTSEPLSLSGLVFRRVETGSAAPAEFRATRWKQAESNEQLSLQPRGCIQLLLPEAADFSIEPGKDLPDVPGCANLQGWMILPDTKSWFWISDAENDSFEVILDGQVVQTCSTASGNCRFTQTRP